MTQTHPHSVGVEGVKDNKYFAFIGYQADTDSVAIGITTIILWAEPNGRRIKQLKQQTWKSTKP